MKSGAPTCDHFLRSLVVDGKGYTNASARVAVLPLISATPTITGTVKAGNVLTVKRGTWTWGAAFKYRWLRNGVPISGAR
ncbi:hypothetical protein SAMN04487914_10718 [Arthrobacter sp. ok909]|nr:hypothetical protein SAMN04487914_10718 [Arthrobacter sp. ok909]